MPYMALSRSSLPAGFLPPFPVLRARILGQCITRVKSITRPIPSLHKPPPSQKKVRGTLDGSREQRLQCDLQFVPFHLLLLTLSQVLCLRHLPGPLAIGGLNQFDSPDSLHRSQQFSSKVTGRADQGN